MRSKVFGDFHYKQCLGLRGSRLSKVCWWPCRYPGSKPSGTLWQSQCSGVSIDYSGSTAFSDVAQCQDGVRSSYYLEHSGSYILEGLYCS